LRRSPSGSKAARDARRYTRDLGGRVWPHAHGPGGQQRSRPPPERVHDVAGRRWRQAWHYARRKRRLGLQRHQGPGSRARPTCDDPSIARIRTHEADLSLPGPGLSPDGRARECSAPAFGVRRNATSAKRPNAGATIKDEGWDCSQGIGNTIATYSPISPQNPTVVGSVPSLRRAPKRTTWATAFE